MTPPDTKPTTKAEHLSAEDRQQLQDIANRAMATGRGFGSVDDSGVEMAWASHVLRLIAQVVALETSLKKESGCEVCWTTSWEPVENEEDCVLAEHPHPEESCFRCGQCALIEAYRKLEAEREGWVCQDCEDECREDGCDCDVRAGRVSEDDDD